MCIAELATPNILLTPAVLAVLNILAAAAGPFIEPILAAAIR